MSVLLYLPAKQLGYDDKWAVPDCGFMASGGRPLHGVLKRFLGPEVSVVVPASYFAGPFHPLDGTIGAAGTLLITMHRETPYPYPIRDKAKKLKRGIQDWLTVLVYDYISLDKVIEAYIGVLTQATRKGETIGVFPYVYDLERFDIPEDKNTNQIDLFFAGDENDKTDVIICSRLGHNGRINPQCRHLTSANGVKIKYNYQRRHLGEWRNMKSNVSLLIKCILQDKE